MELISAVTSIYFCGKQKEGNGPFVLKRSHQGEIRARINDLGRKEVELCFFLYRDLEMYKLFLQNISMKAGSTHGNEEIAKLILPFQAMT